MDNDDGYIGFGCPFCGTNVDFQSQYGGTVQTCPNCGETVVVAKEDGGEGTALPLPVETEHLQLRRFVEDDWEDLLAYLSDAEVLRYLDHEPMTEEEINEWIRAVMAEQLARAGERLHLAIVHKESGNVIGDIGLWLLDHEHLQASFDICLNKVFHSKGLATEACQGLFDFCFCAIGLHRVSARCDGRNKAAARLLEKLAMRKEGEFRQSRRHKGEWVDTIWYAILGDEYRQRSGA